MNKTDLEYNRLLNLVLENGRLKKNRTGIDTIGVFGAQARFDLSETFPLLTTKKVWFKGIVHELLWFLSGSTNIKYLVDNGVGIWDEWAYKRYCERVWQQYGKDHPSYQILSLENWRLYAAEADFELGEGTYGGMWRAFPYSQTLTNNTFDFDGNPHTNKRVITGNVDQIQKIIDKLKTNPDDRRLIVSAWHPYWVDNCALPPCHVLFQFHTEELTLKEREDIYASTLFMEYGAGSPYGLENDNISDEKKHQYLNGHNIPKRRLNCQLYQRSCDLFLGVPFNIASYSLLTCMLAQVSGMIPGEFIHTYGDLHIYTNHLSQVKEQLSREPKKLPKLILNPEIKNLFDFKYEDIGLEGYDPHPGIKGEVAV